MIDQTEPIWREYIQDTEEVALDCWRMLFDYHRALKHQGAPPELVAAMAEITNLFAQANRKLQELKPSFPKEP